MHQALRNTVEAKYNELTSEVNFADDLEPAQIKQWREMTKAKKKEIGEYRDQLNKLEMDMMKADVEAKLKEIMAEVPGVEDLFAYRRGSIGFVRFPTASGMWNFIRKF